MVFLQRNRQNGVKDPIESFALSSEAENNQPPQHMKSIFPIVKPMIFEDSVREYLRRCADVGNHHVNAKYTVMEMMVEARASDGKTALLSHGKLRSSSGKEIEDSSRAKSLQTLLDLWDIGDYPIRTE
jgi:hypothetical protein